MKKRALLSVSNKENLIPFAKKLWELDFELVSTGGTKKKLEEAGIDVISISEVTKFPEILEGRVKTLHPNVHGGLLAKRNNPSHQETLADLNIKPIELVVVNLYPFQATIMKESVTEEEAIENIDIGGPTMLRAAAKNHQDVLVVVDPSDYDLVVESIEKSQLTAAFRKKLAAKVFRHTAQYDAMIANYFTEEEYPQELSKTYEKVQTLRYGENPHQTAAFYRDPLYKGTSLANAKQLNGKELSYNNIQDANAALNIILDFDQPTVVAVKHMNPCGVGIGESLEEAYLRAYDSDPISIFGGIVALNRQVDEATAMKMKEIFLEIIIAPSFSQEAIEILSAKKNLRLLEVGFNQVAWTHQITHVSGGVLVQQEDKGILDTENINVPTERQPTEQEWKDLKLAWKVVKHVKSNAIVVAKDMQTVGVGAGQMNRVGAAKIAFEQAGEKAHQAALASDAFFPMADTVETAAKAGITAIIQPGGSIKDQASIDACNRYGIAMVFTGMRHFKH